MKNYRFYYIFICLFAFACSPQQKENEVEKEDNSTSINTDAEPSSETYNGFRKISPKEISDNLFMIHDNWMLVTAGNDSLFNSMTASWGGFGTVWEKPVALMFIRDTRFTFDFLQRESVYTLSFFDEKYKDVLQLLGSKSGRNTDKMKESGLTSLIMPSGAPSFSEASLIVECKKLLSQPIDSLNITSKEVMKWYKDEPGTHNIFLGEIIGVWKKEDTNK